MKRKIKIELNLTDSQIKTIRDASKGGKVSKIRVRIEATHSGFVNKNLFFYTPRGMSDGISSFIDPYHKPVHVNHDEYSSPIGRVLESKYIDYTDIKGGIIDKIKNTENPMVLVQDIKKFIKGTMYASEDFKGLGHAELIAEITDSDAIEKVLDKRYLTVSISGGVDSAICSACGSDKKEENSCDHYRGEFVDGEKVFYIGGLMDFSEVSYVSAPADPHASSEVISDFLNLDDESEFIKHRLEILDYEIQTGENPSMKKKLAELLAQPNILADALGALGLSACALTDEDYSGLRKSTFLFATDRQLPLNDKAHVLAAYKALEDAEESEDLTAAMKVLDRKFKKLFDEGTSLEDAISQLVAEQSASTDPEDGVTTPAAADTIAQPTAEEVAAVLGPLLSDQIIEKLKGTFTVDDSFSASRLEALESEVEALEAENREITDSYKNVIVNQILITEDKVGDEAYKARLHTRGLDSLSDKLEDLGFGIVIADSSAAGSDDTGSDAELDSSVDINDASTDGVQNDDEPAVKPAAVKDPGAEKLSVNQIRDEYRKLFREKSIVAANAYLKDLRDNEQLPDNFTF